MTDAARPFSTVLIPPQLPLRYWVMPLAAMMVFVTAMSGWLWVLHRRDIDENRNALQRDTEWAQQAIKLRLLSGQDLLLTLARDAATGVLTQHGFTRQIESFQEHNPEMVAAFLVDEQRRIRWATEKPTIRQAGERIAEAETVWGWEVARDDRRPVFTRPYLGPGGQIYVEAHTPVFRRDQFAGTVVGLFSLDGTLQHVIPSAFSEKYRWSFLDASGKLLVTSTQRQLFDPELSYGLTLDPPGHGVVLQANAFRAGSNPVQSMLVALVVGLSMAIVGSLWTLWRDMKSRASAETALAGEAMFRKALEDSMVAGLRVVDPSGRITYVNRAFSGMTGWSVEELIGQVPPFPYWPPEYVAAYSADYAQMLKGNTPPNGFDAVVLRRDGSRFDARMYVSPLLDANGKQEGWLTTIADISESKRAREALLVAQDRLTAVFDGLEAAISVLPLRRPEGNVELLFANRTYRELFGTQADGHMMLAQLLRTTEAKTARPPEALPNDPVSEGDTPVAPPREGEVFVAGFDRWFDVRERSIFWVDGRVVRLQIAADTTARRHAEELFQRQQEKAQFNSRLVTMGEMASSLAHELNQPLTAIANYNSGLARRLQRGAAKPEDVTTTVEKTAQQAERAGKIIRRIRDFVKKNAPSRSWCKLPDIIDAAVGFAEIDARKADIAIRVKLPPKLPDVWADPILLEQVLLNLLRNAVEAMQEATMRFIRVDVVVEGENVTISVTDHGHGVAADSMEQLFSPFYTTKPEGMGMGLSICRSIIEFHQGRLWVEPNPAGGAIFRILLPIGG